MVVGHAVQELGVVGEDHGVDFAFGDCPLVGAAPPINAALLVLELQRVEAAFLDADVEPVGVIRDPVGQQILNVNRELLAEGGARGGDDLGLLGVGRACDSNGDGRGAASLLRGQGDVLRQEDEEGDDQIRGGEEDSTK